MSRVEYGRPRWSSLTNEVVEAKMASTKCIVAIGAHYMKHECINVIIREQ